MKSFNKRYRYSHLDGVPMYQRVHTQPEEQKLAKIALVTIIWLTVLGIALIQY